MGNAHKPNNGNGRNRFGRRSAAFRDRQDELRRGPRLRDYHEVNYVQRCPLCGKTHESKDHDVGWYFPCCCGNVTSGDGGYRLLVWVDKGNRLELETVASPEDAGLPDEEDLRNAP